MIITINDVRRVFCAPGARRFAEENGLNFREFLREGMDEAVLREAIGDDALLDRVIAAKVEVENG